MANNLLVNGIVAKEALSVLRNMLPMTQKVNKQFQSTVRDQNARHGDIINFKRPPRYLGRTGELMKVESTIETSAPLTMGFYGQDVSFSQKDLQMSMDDVKRGGLATTLEPAMASIAAQIEAAGTLLYRGVATSVGTPGTPPTTVTPVAQANAYITAAGGQLGRRAAIIDPFSNASLADNLKLVFNPSSEISEQYLKGRMGTAFGFDFYDDALVQSHTAGVYGGTPTVTTAGQTGNVLVTGGWTPTTTSLNVGDTFTIAGVNSVNPQSRQDTGKPAFFVVAAKTVTDGAGVSIITIGGQGLIAGGAFQNVSAAPAAGAAITVTSGASGQVSRQSLLFAPEAFTFASAPLALPDGVSYAGRETDEMSGLSIRVVSDYSISTNQMLTRFDVFCGWALAYPELAVRLQG